MNSNAKIEKERERDIYIDSAYEWIVQNTFESNSSYIYETVCVVQKQQKHRKKKQHKTNEKQFR